MLPRDQTEQLKNQLIEHINSTFPEDRKSSAIKQIESMNEEQFEEFLIQNNLINEGENKKSISPEGKCIFCSLVFGDIPSTKIGENEKAIAVLELNPISKGHAIVIPKDHVTSTTNLPKEALKLAGEIGGKIKTKFFAKEIIIEPTNMFGHEIINIIPVYENENLDSPRTQSNPEELTKIKEELENEKIEEVGEEPQKEINEKNTWLNPRLP